MEPLTQRAGAEHDKRAPGHQRSAERLCPLLPGGGLRANPQRTRMARSREERHVISNNDRRLTALAARGIIDQEGRFRDVRRFGRDGHRAVKTEQRFVHEPGVDATTRAP